MPDEESTDDGRRAHRLAPDRRTFLRMGSGAVALAASAGVAEAHGYGAAGSDSASSGHDHTDASQHDATSDVERLDYHSLGDLGPSSESGSPDSPHYGGLSELRTVGDYAYVGIFSSDTPTGDRGMAVLDISEFNEADNTSELREADLEVVSFLRNDNAAAAVMDVKLSDDGEYVFISKQPYTALFNEMDPKPDDDGDGTSTSAAALQAVDVSDPADPVVVGTYDVWETGPHNAWYHRIDGADYVFAVKDLNDGTSGIYVFEFDRTTGALVVVNKWDAGGNLSDGNLVDESLNYAHDLVVQDDPRLGIPVGYFAYWNSGLFALDLSDPTDITPIGHFSMPVTHYAEPAPEFIDGKRILVAGQEVSSTSGGSSGMVKLLDADGLDEGFDGSDNMVELDTWEWKSETSFSNFTLSPHNFAVTADRWVHLGHYHGGTRFLRITGDWNLEEKGYFQAAEDVPEDSKAGGINHAAPFTWCAVEHQGVVYVSDVNTGVYALRYKPSSSASSLAPLGTAATGSGLLYRYRKRLADVLGGISNPVAEPTATEAGSTDSSGGASGELMDR